MNHTVIFLIYLFSMLGYSEAGLRNDHHSNLTARGPLTRRKAKVNPKAPNGLDASKFNPKLTSQCKIPSAKKTIRVTKPIIVAAGKTFDCKFAKYQRSDTHCNLDHEKGDEAAVFILKHKAILKNCILGFSQESVHCKGSCRVENSHWLQICDEAISFHMKSGSATVSGCSFSNAGNKALQFNGGGTLYVQNSCFYNVDIAYRSCGNCKTTTKRAAVFKNVALKGVKTFAGYNHKHRDTVDIQSFTGKPAQTMCEAKDAKGGKGGKGDKKGKGSKKGKRGKGNKKEKGQGSLPPG